MRGIIRRKDIRKAQNVIDKSWRSGQHSNEVSIGDAQSGLDPSLGRAQLGGHPDAAQDSSSAQDHAHAQPSEPSPITLAARRRDLSHLPLLRQATDKKHLRPRGLPQTSRTVSLTHLKVGVKSVAFPLEHFC